MVLNESEFYIHEDLFFEDSAGYILRDKAYRLTNRVIKPYSILEMSKDETGGRCQFNIQLSLACVKVEHAFGFIKARFPLMGGLSTIIGSQKGNKKAVDFVFAICILHNFLHSLEEAWVATDEEEIMIADNTDNSCESILQSRWAVETEYDERSRNAKKVGALKRDWLTDEVLDWLTTHHRIH